MEADTIEAVTKKLQADNFIEITINGGPPYLIQKSLFNSVAPFFVTRGQPYAPRYSVYGSTNTWKTFLYWAVKRDPLPVQEPTLLMDCLRMGSTHRIPTFQDAAMIELLRFFEKPDSRVDCVHVYKAYKNDINSEVQELLMEELVKSLYHYNISPIDAELNDLGEIHGFLPDLIQTQKRFMKDKDSFFRRFTKRAGRRERDGRTSWWLVG